MITFVCWKYKPTEGYDAKRRHYAAEHVNELQAALAKHCREAHQLVCITDDPAGIDCPTIDMPIVLPDNYRKLWVYSEEAAKLLPRGRIAVTDLDVAVIDDPAPLISFRHRLQVWVRSSKGRINTSLVSFAPGGWLPGIWDTFIKNPSKNGVHARAWCAKRLDKEKGLGSDQAWLMYYLHNLVREKHASFPTGIYRALDIRDLPDDARLVYFPGNIKPWYPEAKRKWPWLARPRLN
jgi:hypothetical protein